MILVYVTGDSGYPNRDAAVFSFPVVVFAAAFFSGVVGVVGVGVR